MTVRYDMIQNNDWFNSVSGEHYITTGMNFYSKTNHNIQDRGFNLDNILIENSYRDNLVKEWNNIAKSKTTLLQFLKKHIHKKK